MLFSLQKDLLLRSFCCRDVLPCRHVASACCLLRGLCSVLPGLILLGAQEAAAAGSTLPRARGPPGCGAVVPCSRALLKEEAALAEPCIHICLHIPLFEASNGFWSVSNFTLSLPKGPTSVALVGCFLLPGTLR